MDIEVVMHPTTMEQMREMDDWCYENDPEFLSFTPSDDFDMDAWGIAEAPYYFTNQIIAVQFKLTFSEYL